MTTLQAKLINESSPTGTLSESPQSAQSNIFYLEINGSQPIAIPNTISIDDLVKEFEQDPDMAEAIAFSRKNLATTIYEQKLPTFSSIRLAAGLSQSQLAEKAFTSQPHIARIESGKTDPSTDVIAKIAKALDQDEALVFSAIRNQRKLQEN